MEQVESLRSKTVEFVRKYGLKVCRIGVNKRPYENDWNKPEFFEPIQEEILEGFIKGNWMIGIITGVKCANGLYLAVVDVDSKKFYEKVMARYDNQTTVVQSGGLKKWGGKKEVSLHYYFFVQAPFKTFRKHDKGYDLEVDLQCRGVQVVAAGSLHPDTGKPYTFVNDAAPMVWQGDLLLDLKQMVSKAFKIKLETEAVNVTALLEGPVEKGNRDNAAFQLATWYRMKGKEKEEIKEILHRWRAEKCIPNDDDFTDDVIDQKVESAFGTEKPYAIKFTEEETFSDAERDKVQWLMANPEEIPKYIFEANAEIVHEEKNRVIIVILNFGGESMEISGKSAGGKSRLADSCLKCFSSTLKDNVIRKITSISPKSRRYMKEPPQTMYIAERAGMDKGLDETSVEYDIKVGISEHVITATRVNPDTRETEEFSIPFGNAVFTSTEIAPPIELGNRIFNLSVDDSKEQNSAVVDFKLDQASKLPAERTNTDAQKKVLRLLFKNMRELNLKNEDFIIPFAPTLKKLLPSSETSIRRHTDKLLGAIYAFAKLMYKKLPTLEVAGKTRYLVPPEVFWYVFKIGDEAIFMQVVGMNKTQMRYWNIMLGLFAKRHGLGVSIKDVAEKTKRARGTISKLFDFFEENGLIATRVENREKWADLITGGSERWEDQNQQLTLADLREEYEKWLKSHACLLAHNHKLRLLDPFTEEEISGNDANIKFGLNFNTVKMKEPEERCVQKSQQSPSLGSFEDAFKS
jgi:DNA-binding MarR family transcriptional regulator